MIVWQSIRRRHRRPRPVENGKLIEIIAGVPHESYLLLIPKGDIPLRVERSSGIHIDHYIAALNPVIRIRAFKLGLNQRVLKLERERVYFGIAGQA